MYKHFLPLTSNSLVDTKAPGISTPNSFIHPLLMTVIYGTLEEMLHLICFVMYNI